ncbi:hypothetical protein [Paenibacillus crassostreae]|uniref:Uncharacterized protein n=1 Tax=Paenibacillus crassostreae TaxID=1763538 RepID=A0A167C2K4_9BACL|nr:hypothetical protein [Paenibacillus crassostreae]AOZ91725.1 hypothetical protein LPB68_05500 [Paenibacillus crassostreae]OAB72702.1 hypothetical protein PNBC_14750 [Paenibacillus crassostreae]
MDYIWLLVVALGVISSIMNKGKTKSKDNPNSMPTFGGTGEGSLDPQPSRESDNTNERTLVGNRTQQPYSMTGEGISQMRDYSELDHISNSSVDEWDAYATSDEGGNKNHLTEVAQQAVNGVIWSEILGPPRSKNAFNKRKL